MTQFNGKFGKGSVCLYILRFDFVPFADKYIMTQGSPNQAKWAKFSPYIG
jgi:hypothetical protein